MPMTAYRMFHPAAQTARRFGGLKERLRRDAPWLLGGAVFGAHMGNRAHQLRASVPPVNALPDLEPPAAVPGDGGEG